MRIFYLLIAVIVLATTACKKEIQTTFKKEIETTAQRAEVVNAASPCTGNDWDYASAYLSRGLALTYNDKIYVPDYASQTVKMYDGSGWISIASAVPIYTTGGNPDENLYSMVAFTIGSKGYIMKPHDLFPGF